MPRKKATWQLITIQDLADFRRKKGFRSDAQLAEALEVSIGSIAGWKKGVRAPSLRVQQQILAKLKAGDAKKRPARTTSKATEELVKRLLLLAPEVKDPSALIEAASRLLQADAHA